MQQFYADYALIIGGLSRNGRSLDTRIIRLFRAPRLKKFVRSPVPTEDWTFRNLAEVGRMSRDDSAD